MEIPCQIEYRNIKYPRLEFKGLQLHVILPPQIKDATQIIEKRKAWIQRKWEIIQESIKNTDIQEDFMILGEPYTIEYGDVLNPIIDQTQKKIKINPKNPKHKKIIIQQLISLLKQKAEKVIEELSSKLKFKPNKIMVKQQKTKWGSCSNKRNISLNLKLVCLPEEIIKYVIYHEITHLRHKKHNQAFWQTINQEFPNYKQQERKLLKYWFQTEIFFQNLKGR